MNIQSHESTCQASFRLHSDVSMWNWYSSWRLKYHFYNDKGIPTGLTWPTGHVVHAPNFLEWKSHAITRVVIFSNAYLQSWIISKQRIAVYNLGSHVWVSCKCLQHWLGVWSREHILHQLWIFHHLLHEALHCWRIKKTRWACTTTSATCTTSFSSSWPRVWKRIPIFLPLLWVRATWKRLHIC